MSPLIPMVIEPATPLAVSPFRPRELGSGGCLK
jgi:hypothetical protein